MKIGFTGTRDGMKVEQLASFQKAIIHFKPVEFHHGDCLGSDYNAHKSVRLLLSDCKIIQHPPLIDVYRAYTKCDEYRLRNSYLDRNRDIVDDTDILIATPSGFNELKRSGTWSTVRYGESRSRRVLVIYPNGKMYYRGSIFEVVL